MYGTRRRVHEKSVYPCVYPSMCPGLGNGTRLKSPIFNGFRHRVPLVCGLKNLPVRESTSFTSMGSLVRVQLSPPTAEKLEKSSFSSFFSLPHGGTKKNETPGTNFDVNGMTGSLRAHRSMCTVWRLDVYELPELMCTECWHGCERNELWVCTAW